MKQVEEAEKSASVQNSHILPEEFLNFGWDTATESGQESNSNGFWLVAEPTSRGSGIQTSMSVGAPQPQNQVDSRFGFRGTTDPNK